MTKVLVIEPAGNLRGSERALLAALDGADGIVPAVCCPPDKPLNAEIGRRNIPLFPYFVDDLHRKEKWRRLAAALGVVRACYEFWPDVIYLNQAGAYKTTLLASTLLHIPIVAHIRLFEEVGYLARQRVDPRRLRSLIVVSSASLEEVRRFSELDHVPCHLAYDPYSSFMGSYESEATRNRQSIACVGRLEAEKGPQILVDALVLLHQDYPGLICAFAGMGNPDFVENLRLKTRGGGVSENVRWIDFTDDVPRLLRKCGILVCPSYRETLGRTVLEAWDAGALPVVFAGSGGAAEVVRAARGGVLYDQQTPESLADALRVVLRLPSQEIADLIGNGRSWLSKNCDPKRYGRAFAGFMRQACGADELH